MKTSIPNISKPYLLDEFVESTKLIVKLFTNDVKGNEENITFTEPEFTGYHPQNIDNTKWSVSVLNANYAICLYTIPIVFNNLDEIYLSEPINGYFVENEYGENLWYERFEESKILDINEGISINLTVNLNKPGTGRTYITIVLESSDPSNHPLPDSTTVSISNEFWGDVPVDGSLIDVMNREFSSYKNIFNLVLTSGIFPSEEAPFTFTALFESFGFEDLTEDIIISNRISNVITINLTPLENPPPKPTPIPEPNYSENDLITLIGPYDSKGGATFISISEDSFLFSFKETEVFIPANMLLFVNDLCVAGIDYFAGYEGQPFIYTFGGHTFNGVFTDPEVRFNIDGPPPTLPPIG